MFKGGVIGAPSCFFSSFSYSYEFTTIKMFTVRSVGNFRCTSSQVHKLLWQQVQYLLAQLTCLSDVSLAFFLISVGHDAPNFSYSSVQMSSAKEKKT